MTPAAEGSPAVVNTARGPRTPMRGRAAVAVVVLLLSAAIVGAYWQVPGAGFVFDDELHIRRNPRLQGGLSLAGLRWAATSFFASNWHPVTWVSHLLDVSLFGTSPRGPHLVNLLLHIGATGLLFSALRAATGATGRSAAVAAIFALHPLRVESVAWVSERKDLLSLFFGFAALRWYVAHARRPRLRTMAAVTACFALALMSKPVLVTLPLLLLLLDRWPLDRPVAAPLLLEKAPLFLLAGGSCVVTLLAQTRGGAAVSLEVFPVAVRLSNAAISYVRYLGKFFWPEGLAVYYPHPGRIAEPPVLAGALLLLAALTGAAALLSRRRAAPLVGWLWFLVALLPMIGLVQVGAQALADRYMSLPLVGLALALVWSLDDLAAGRPGLRPPLVAVGAVVLVLLAALTWRQAGHWRDCESLFSQALAATEENWMMHLNLGNCLSEKGRSAEAAREYGEAVRIRPGLAAARNNYALELAALGKTAEAFAQYRAALSLQPDYADALVGLGLLLAEQENTGEAAALFRRALAASPGRPDAHRYLARLLEFEGKRPEALRHRREAARLESSPPAAGGALAVPR